MPSVSSAVYPFYPLDTAILLENTSTWTSSWTLRAVLHSLSRLAHLTLRFAVHKVEARVVLQEV